MGTPTPKPAAAVAGSVPFAPATPLAQLMAHLHPLLLLALPSVDFASLVADPVATLLARTPLLAGLQLAYCVVCVPLPGTSSSNADTPLKPGAKRRKAPRSVVSEGWARMVPALLAQLLTLTLATPLLALLLLLFGAPLTTHHAPTALLALHLALLTTPALFYAHGLAVPVWRRLASLQQPLDAPTGMALGALVGAWLGAIPIPLDWDRDWQRWPVTVVVGAYAGAAVGRVAGTLVKGRGWVLGIS